ncbi:MAG: PKD domain-containing protein, partial [Bacteroidales bacterium]|nr:PKD domain-containing protein [Bacteroidales bacterium]
IDDISGDGINDVLIGTLYSNNYCYFLNGVDGSELHSINFGEPVDAIAAIPDITEDGSMEMVAGGRNGKVYCYSGGLNSVFPVADFTADITSIEVGDSINFTDLSVNNPTDWYWIFEGGTPLTSTEQNPTVVYYSPGSYSVTLIVTNAYGSDSLIKPGYIFVETPSFYLDIKAFFEGPYYDTSMYRFLNTYGYMPNSQPYNISPWYYNGTESVASIPNNDIVDWILIELRETPGDASTANSSTMISQKAAFILKDGIIVDLDGTSFPVFNLAIFDNLYVAIWHRNHLGVMSAIPLIKAGCIYSYDFTVGSGQAYGGILAHKEIASGVWGMVGGDSNPDGQINNSDKIDVWIPQSGNSGYLEADFNMSGTVDNQDKNDVWLPNSGSGSQIPDNTPTEGFKCQVPK